MYGRLTNNLLTEMKHQGMPISPSTVCDVLKRFPDLFQPLVEEFLKHQMSKSWSLSGSVPPPGRPHPALIHWLESPAVGSQSALVLQSCPIFDPALEPLPKSRLPPARENRSGVARSLVQPLSNPARTARNLCRSSLFRNLLSRRKLDTRR